MGVAIIIIVIITLQTANPNWDSLTPKAQGSQHGRQPSKERENYVMITRTAKTNNNNKGFGKTKSKVNKIQKHLKVEGHRVDYSPFTPNKKALAPSLSFCSSAASTIMLGQTFHNLGCSWNETSGLLRSVKSHR